MHGAYYQVKGSNELVIFILLSYFSLRERNETRKSKLFRVTLQFPDNMLHPTLGQGNGGCRRRRRRRGRRRKRVGPFPRLRADHDDGGASSTLVNGRMRVDEIVREAAGRMHFHHRVDGGCRMLGTRLALVARRLGSR